MKIALSKLTKLFSFKLKDFYKIKQHAVMISLIENDLRTHRETQFK